MPKDVYFISTSLEANIDNTKNKIFAGNWCISNYDQENSIDKNLVLGDVWEDKKERGGDYKYLQNIIKIYSKGLSSYLNSIHGYNFSDKFWKSIFLSWLSIYLPAYYYRWKIVKKITKKKKNLKFYDLYNLESKDAPLDTYDFHYKVSSDNYINYRIFRSLIKFFIKKNNKIKLIKKKSPNYKKKENNGDKSYWLNFKIKKIFNYFLYLIFNQNKIFIENNVFRIIDNIKLNFLLGQFPTYPNDTFSDSFGFKNFYNNKKTNLKRRRSHNLRLGKNDEFTKFIETNMRDDLPICFIEGFDNLFKYMKKISIKPKIILSSHNHYFNELFKVWIAYLREKKYSKLFIVSHGGGGFLKYPSCLKFESQISDKKINWHKSNQINEIQLPASKFLTRKTIKSSNEFISYVEGPTTLFPSRIGYGTINNGSPNLHANFTDFYKRLKKNLKKDIIFLPKKEYEVDTTKYLRNYLSHNQIKENNSFNKYNKRSKLNILSYPETTFSESLTTKPTILLYDKE